MMINYAFKICAMPSNFARINIILELLCLTLCQSHETELTYDACILELFLVAAVNVSIIYKVIELN